MSRELDSHDRRILALLQVRGDIGPAELSETIHLSMSQCSRRLQRLRTEGYVDRVVALLDLPRLKIGMTIYVMVTLKSHMPEIIRAFNDRVISLVEITECHKLSGEGDYMLKVCTRDLQTYNALLNTHLLVAPEIGHLKSSIVLESLKSTTALPLEFL